jgi:hypothetical protein
VARQYDPAEERAGRGQAGRQVERLRGHGQAGQELDASAYKIYRGFSVGARKTTKAYGGREGLHQLPDARGGMNGGFIGFRRAAETSGRKSPAIDLNTPELGYVKFHFVR